MKRNNKMLHFKIDQRRGGVRIKLPDETNEFYYFGNSKKHMDSRDRNSTAAMIFMLCSMYFCETALLLS